MKFSHTIKLKRDLPTYKAGWEFKWDGTREMYFPREPSRWKSDFGKPSIYLDYKHQGFTVEQGQDADWFEPVSEAVDFIPAFPSSKALEEYVYLSPDTRLVDDVDFCRAFNRMVATKAFQKKLYEFYRDEYNATYGLQED